VSISLRRLAVALAVVALIADGVAIVAITRRRATHHPAAAKDAGTAGTSCRRQPSPPPPSIPPKLTQAQARSMALARSGSAGAAVSWSRAMDVLSYLGLCGLPAQLRAGTYDAVWVVSVTAATGPYTAVIDADSGGIVGLCTGAGCAGAA